jgi:hypothetical protein
MHLATGPLLYRIPVHAFDLEAVGFLNAIRNRQNNGAARSKVVSATADQDFTGNVVG